MITFSFTTLALSLRLSRITLRGRSWLAQVAQAQARGGARLGGQRVVRHAVRSEEALYLASTLTMVNQGRD